MTAKPPQEFLFKIEGARSSSQQEKLKGGSKKGGSWNRSILASSKTMELIYNKKNQSL